MGKFFEDKDVEFCKKTLGKASVAGKVTGKFVGKKTKWITKGILIALGIILCGIFMFLGAFFKGSFGNIAASLVAKFKKYVYKK